MNEEMKEIRREVRQRRLAEWQTWASIAVIFSMAAAVCMWYVESTASGIASDLEARINKGWFTERMFDNRMRARDQKMADISGQLSRMRENELPRITSEVSAATAQIIMVREDIRDLMRFNRVNGTPRQGVAQSVSANR